VNPLSSPTLTESNDEELDDYVLADLRGDESENEHDDFQSEEFPEEEELEAGPQGEEEETFDTGELKDEEELLESEQDVEDEAQPEEPAEDEVMELKIYGEKKYVRKSEVVETGIRAMQKVLAADKLLEEAKAAQKQAREYLERLKAGEVPKGEEIAPEDPEPEPEEVQQPPRQEVSRTPSVDVAKIQARFREEFGDVAGSAKSMKIASLLVGDRLAAGEPNSWETYQAAGKEVRDFMRRSVVKPEMKISFEKKLEMKRRIDNVPTVGGAIFRGGVTPGGAYIPTQAESEGQARREAIANMRRIRGQV
jgi:hypothetical protein